MRKILLFFLALSSISIHGFSQPLSPSAKVSLLICAPGNEIYSYFGHAAIRVNDPLYEKDIVFNYGVFDFMAPHFYWRFAKGETDYMLAVQRMDSFMQEYHEEQRRVVEYELMLTPAERESLYEALVENYKPENRIYRYNHFDDNCATRVRDQLEKAVGGNIKYDTSGDERLSFRNLIDRYIQDNSWGGLGIKLALGIPTDRLANFSQKMFLPDYLGNDMARAQVIRGGIASPLTKPAQVIFDAPAFVPAFSLTSPAVVILFFLVLVLALTFLERKKKRRFIWLDVCVFVALGIAGMILFFTTFISVMPSAKWNLNLIWAFPVHFLVGILWLFPSMRPKLNWYIRLTAHVTTLFLISIYFLPQTFHWLVVPLCLILLMRTGVYLPGIKQLRLFVRSKSFIAAAE
ncbi:MAG: DUF4105 domain-containing protein [Bacteroidetes bacterium]|nr:DUF4105 domain-containing protein [Bacteroidota bacterium]MCL6100921.1 DUF4105 domain-containing protein [Bacteroidota bacterium]